MSAVYKAFHGIFHTFSHTAENVERFECKQETEQEQCWAMNEWARFERMCVCGK